LDTFKGVVPIHGNQHIKNEFRFTNKLVRATRTSVTKPPSSIVAPKSNLNTLIHEVSNRNVDVEAYRKLFPEVRAERGIVEVADCLDE
jgi:hypothetical protein